ncbi:PAS domain S-box [Synechococcus sp. PCC 7502]|uniref:response regulator n=1 Tax=Synechococcus sp. PCC 7502 TaxID=1173263 RepID=UPI00029FFDAC|nr:response regulator [Synechococcus sp. PCC 7502]AFY73861.1 PAS domain S-box [Synechococcus sp. PCC 7502]
MNPIKPAVIFIVEDNPDNIRVLVRVLESAGYKTLVAMDGTSGIQKITKAMPDLILLDIMMPGIDGFETCKLLKQSLITQDIPIIFMTALASVADKVKGLSLGAVDYITKPFQQEEVIARIELHIKLRQLAQTLALQNQQLKLEISRREKVEESLQILSKATEQSPASIVITNVYGEIEYVNPKFEELTGYTLAEVKGANSRILKTGFTSPESYQDMWQSISNGEDWHGEFQNRKKNGELYWEYASISAIKNIRGEITHYVAVKEDITQRKLAQQSLLQLNQELEDMVTKRTSALQQSEQHLKQINEQLMLSNLDLARATRLKDEFLANMSHELRTPLNAVLGLSEALQEELFGELNDRQKKSLAIIENSGEHLLRLINDILDLAKIESGKLELHIGEASVQSLCHDSVTFIQQIALSKNIKVSILISDRFKDEKNFKIQVDELRVRQALINLLSNAVKFTPEGGNISLEITEEVTDDQEDQKEVSYICFAVRDNGIGIAPKDVKQLFQPFIQIDSALNRQYNGTGLGLALVKNIAQLHGGTVNVESELDKGSCFTMRLPCRQVDKISPATTNIPASNQEQPSSLQMAPFKILIAEDNQANIDSLWDYLESKGYILSVAHDGQEAIDVALSDHPDIILMDIQMPKMDGLTAITQIRANPVTANIPIIALTALAMSGDREKCLGAGADEYLSKPVKLKQLVSIIQKLLAAAIAQRLEN